MITRFFKRWIIPAMAMLQLGTLAVTSLVAQQKATVAPLTPEEKIVPHLTISRPDDASLGSKGVTLRITFPADTSVQGLHATLNGAEVQMRFSPAECATK